MRKAKAVVGIGIVAIFAFSVWMALAVNPLNGIAVFFVLTGLLWAIARIRNWI
ncbi:MAG: hypothetical protein KA243_07805 [Candidatus Aminicenantes bacterium]|nr:hypothetical protein [Candidatus Aminicenantes bacterium]NLH77840.1 hypothetical protein [Acidobacteriota bacterium]